MLEILRIKDLAVIHDAEIRFKPGFNVISGETGAGKSIVLEAISLLLGGRASSDMIRSGCSEALIEGVFEVSAINWMQERLERFGFPTGAGELLIKRVIQQNGKNRIFINGELGTLAILAELCDGLIDLCGQHEHQSLVKQQTQMGILDRFGGNEALIKTFSSDYAAFRNLNKEQTALAHINNEREKKAEFIRFQVEELKAAALIQGEEELLSERKQLLKSAEQRARMAKEALIALSGEDDSSLSARDPMSIALLRVSELERMDPALYPLRSLLEQAITCLDEAVLGLKKYERSIEGDPETLLQAEERLTLIGDLKRKYGTSVSEMLQTLASLEKELSSLEIAADRKTQIEIELSGAISVMRSMGEQLHRARSRAAIRLGERVTQELCDLNMPGARLQAELSFQENVFSWSDINAGNEIQFLVRTNPGEPSKPIGKVASGGELSRIMLGIRRVVSDEGGIGIYIFDEIDTGVGGRTAFEVGRKLKSVAKHNQVICITHLAQVASFADHHLVIMKRIKNKRSQAIISEVKDRPREEEIARMLGGTKLTNAALKNAAELMQMAQ